LAQWESQGGLSCHQCIEMELVNREIKSCETCKKPRPLPANFLALELYSYGPLRPIPMTEGLIMLDLPSVDFLFRVYDVPIEDQRLLLDKITVYHHHIHDMKNKGKGTTNTNDKNKK